MDVTLVTFLVVFYGIVYLILSNAKGRNGKKFGYRKMALMWVMILPFLTSSVIEFTINYADASTEEVKISLSVWFLWFMPIPMLLSNLYWSLKKANQSPQPTAANRRV